MMSKVHSIFQPTLEVFLCRNTVLFLYIVTLLLMGVYSVTLKLGQIWIIFVTGGLLG